MPSMTALRHRELILVLYDLDYRYERNGEEVCEGHGFSFAECWAIPCCHWDDGECWSSVGQDQCQGKKNYMQNPSYIVKTIQSTRLLCILYYRIYIKIHVILSVCPLCPFF